MSTTINEDEESSSNRKSYQKTPKPAHGSQIIEEIDEEMSGSSVAFKNRMNKVGDQSVEGRYSLNRHDSTGED